MKQRDDQRPAVAAAILYDAEKDKAPRVAARGRGVVAEHIIELARKHHVPVQEDPALAEMLARLDIGEEIPPQLYLAVAEILAFIYRMNGKISERNDHRR
ncbi:MAG: hypothetical protein AVO39_10085 [delta proteobacterium MLS_D]|jgi:flagellar biosynthesis protein|nr:MAG: hypothetical protein AVO39_10085 [delta proteobacterium MLS_D]